MRVLLLSAYAAHSHIQWREALQRMFATWQWCVLELPPRHFSWRVRGNPLHWALTERTQLEKPADLIIATSMVDMATLRGLVPALSGPPLVVYFHENQFAYPLNLEGKAPRQSPVEAQMVSLYSALAASLLLFNSVHNRETFLDGVDALLSRLPDFVPAGVPALLRSKSEIAPVPVIPLQQGQERWPRPGTAIGTRKLRLLWCGRFEYDKGPAQLLCILRELEARGLNYELALVGQQFRQSPTEFETIATEFGHRLAHFGYMASADDYHALLRSADIVLSTALHEFQGLALMEAVTAGCLPVVPDRLAYREFYADCFRYASCPQDPQREAQAAADLIARVELDRAGFRQELPDFTRYSPTALTPGYSALFRSALSNRDGQ